LLRDLKEGSKDALWLSQMLSLNFPGLLWVHHDILPASFRKLLSARDLPYLRRMFLSSHEVQNTTADASGVPTEETRRQLRDLAREMADYLSTR